MAPIALSQSHSAWLLDVHFHKLYHGGKLFGKALNKPDELATSVLAVMVVCMFGGPKFLAKIIPVTKVSAEFQFKIVELP